MKFKVYQIQLSDADVAKINATQDHASVPKQVARLDMEFAKDIGEKAANAFADGFYDYVANIEAISLEGVFEVGNIGPEEKIERLGRMSSVSVGDIIEDENGFRSVVASFGFENVPELRHQPNFGGGERIGKVTFYPNETDFNNDQVNYAIDGLTSIVPMFCTVKSYYAVINGETAVPTEI